MGDSVKKFLEIIFIFLTIDAVLADECLDTAMTQSEITMCSLQSAKKVEDKLTELEISIQHSLDIPQRDLFTQAQISWRSMAENDCMIQRNFYAGGSIAPSVYNSCMESRIEQRINQIKYFLCPSWWMKGECP